MRTRMLAFILAISGVVQSQPPQPRPQKVLTPDQVAYQQQMKTYDADAARLRTAAITAFDDEMTRAKAPECPDAKSTVAQIQCVGHEDDLTGANLKAFTAALRGLLALPRPRFPGEPAVYVGPSGQEATAATNTAAFDKADAAWRIYSTAECDAVDTLWRGGTIVDAMVGSCYLEVTRDRMHELNTIYNLRLYH